jgi:hypothetical protein
MAEQKRKIYNLRGDDEVNLKELQIKLERIHAYIRKTEGRLLANETTLEKLRKKRMEIDQQRQDVAVVGRGRLQRKV